MSCREVARFSETYGSLMNLDRPSGTEFFQCRSMHGPENWNLMAQKVLDGGHDWLLCTEDDHIYPPDTLTRLLAHDKDIVSGLYLKRDLPFEPVAYHELNDGSGEFLPHYLINYAAGLVEVDVVGVGCLLIRRKVFETVPKPWWILTAPPAPPDKINSDVEWCRNVKRHGFQIYCDLEMTIAHIAVVPIAPVRRNNHWQTIVVFGQHQALTLEQEQPKTAIRLVEPYQKRSN